MKYKKSIGEIILTSDKNDIWGKFEKP